MLYEVITPGTDIAFIGGLFNYLLSNDFIQKEYVVHYTNAAFLVNEDFAFNDGLFSGYDAENFHYDKDSWTYQLDDKGVITSYSIHYTKLYDCHPASLVHRHGP